MEKEDWAKYSGLKEAQVHLRRMDFPLMAISRWVRWCETAIR